VIIIDGFEKLNYYIPILMKKKPRKRIELEICERTAEGVKCIKMKEVYRNFGYELGKIPAPKRRVRVVSRFNRELGMYIMYVRYENPSGRYLEVRLVPPPPEPPKTILIFSVDLR